MAQKTLKTRVINKHDIEANWISATNFRPMEGEVIIYDAEVAGDILPEGRTERITYSRMKIGDGVRLVDDLPFVDEEITNEEIDVICGFTQTGYRVIKAEGSADFFDANREPGESLKNFEYDEAVWLRANDDSLSYDIYVTNDKTGDPVDVMYKDAISIEFSMPDSNVIANFVAL